jgi:hypothetical protein
MKGEHPAQLWGLAGCPRVYIGLALHRRGIRAPLTALVR